MSFYIYSIESLGQNICRHVLCWAEMNLDMLPTNFLPNPMHLDVNVFHLAMMFWVPENFERRLVINHKWRWSIDLVAQFTK